MSARIIKEMRALLPAMAATLMLSTILPLLSLSVLRGTPISPELAGGFAGFCLGAGCLIMGASVFGNEFQYRTFAALLAQPISRRALWREKMGALALAIGLCAAGYASLRFFKAPYFSSSEIMDPWPVLIPFCAFCFVPCMTLVVRNTLGGAVFSLGLVSLLFLTSSFVTAHLNLEPAAQENCSELVLAASCVTLFWLGYRKFIKYQSVEGQAQEINLPRAVESRLEGLWPRFNGPIASLICKEIRLQRIVILMAVIFAGLIGVEHLLAHLIPKVKTVYGGEVSQLGSYLVVTNVVYCFLVPIFCGAASVGEEKGWGLSEWHLALPPSKHRQWLTKLSVTLCVSLLLGLAWPLVIALAGEWGEAAGKIVWPEVLAGLSAYVAVQVFFTSVAIFAGTLASNTLRGILLMFALSGLYAASFAVIGDICRSQPVCYIFWEPPFSCFRIFHDGSVVEGLMILGIGGLFALGLVLSLASMNFHYGRARRLSVGMQLLLIWLTVSLAAVTLSANVMAGSEEAIYSSYYNRTIPHVPKQFQIPKRPNRPPPIKK